MPHLAAEGIPRLCLVRFLALSTETRVTTNMHHHACMHIVHFALQF